VSAIATTPNARFTIFSILISTAPNTSYVYDWKDQKLVPWQMSSMPEVSASHFVAPKLESYPARDGTSIPMWVRRPKSCAEPCPVIVHFHGGPEAQVLPAFSTRAQLFVDQGFVYVEPNVRGSSGYGKTWLHADDGPKRLDVITDIEDCAKFIRANWGKSGKAPRIGVFGGSYGGYSVQIAMTMFAGAYDAGVAVVGISNLLTFLENTAPYRRALRASEYGDPEKDREALIKLSPMSYLDRVKGPILLMQGVSDPRVPVGEAVQFHEALQARGLPSELIIFADEGHGMKRRDNSALELGHALRFLRQHLNPQVRASSVAAKAPVQE
jgi:dipeptidyl aminopeptidase/acylaminoacyl peptidase